MCAEAVGIGPAADAGRGGPMTHRIQAGQLGSRGGWGTPASPRAASPVRKRFIWAENRSTIFPSWFRFLPPAASCTKIPGARPIGTRLKEKDTNMNGPARITALAVVLAGMVLSMSGCKRLAARDQLNKGVDAYKSARYEDAINHFQKATELDPSLPMAKSYLATALAQNVVPGLDTPDNLKTANQAIDMFKDVLAKDPHDVNSMKQIAGIEFSIKRLDDAKGWQKRVLNEDSKDPEAAYTVGVIDWTLAHKNTLEALASAGINDDGEAGHSVELAKAAVDSAQDSLDKTRIAAPLDGTITKLNSQLGERVHGTVQNASTEIMTVSDLSQMEARVDIGEMDIVLLQAGQKAKLEVDSFKDKKFAGVVTAVANSSKDLNASSAASAYGGSSSSSGQSATQFPVRIRLTEGDQFRPGMSVSAEIETRTRTNTLAAPIASVTTRTIKAKNKTGTGKTNSVPTNAVAATGSATNSTKADKKSDDKKKPVEVVFVIEGDHVKAVPVKIGISDDNFWEMTDGL